jgi:hypothetical protein
MTSPLPTLTAELNRFLGKPRAKPITKPRRQRSGVNAARLRAHPRVWFVDGRDQGFEDWFITLRAGWHYEGDPGSHAYGFTTLREALVAVERSESCDCEQCQQERVGQ